MFLQDDIKNIEAELEVFKNEHSYVTECYVEYDIVNMAFKIVVYVKPDGSYETVPHEANIYDRNLIHKAITKLEDLIVSKYGD